LTLTGSIRQPPPPGIVLGENIPEPVAPGVTRLQRLELDVLAHSYQGRLLPYELRLDGESASGFVRRWPEPGSGRERHLGYAFQWFAMAVAVAVIYLVLNIRRRGSES
jgi:surfeit locus 1 family protein